MSLVRALGFISFPLPFKNLQSEGIAPRTGTKRTDCLAPHVSSLVWIINGVENEGSAGRAVQGGVRASLRDLCGGLSWGDSTVVHHHAGDIRDFLLRLGALS